MWVVKVRDINCLSVIGWTMFTVDAVANNYLYAEFLEVVCGVECLL